jgi:glycerol uptake facilitator-like aquaporin
VSRKPWGEGLGTALLLYVIVGSAIAAEQLGSDAGTQLLAHALIVGAGLGTLIAMLQTVSGSHFNPAVTLGFWRTKTVSGVEAGQYIAAQIVGAVVGVAAANLSFEQTPISIATTARNGAGLITAEAVATFVLVRLILALVRTGRSGLVPAAVGAWVAAIVFATSSTGFANPAVTIARMFTDTYTGIAPASVAAFLVAQLAAGLFAAHVAIVFYPARVTQQAPV